MSEPVLAPDGFDQRQVKRSSGSRDPQALENERINSHRWSRQKGRVRGERQQVRLRDRAAGRCQGFANRGGVRETPVPQVALKATPAAELRECPAERAGSSRDLG